MPNRILREGILTSPRIARIGWPEEVFYRRLMSVVDDYGRYYADAGMLRAACYPRQLNKVSDSDIGKWLQGIADAALVRVYPAQDGERYLQLLDFRQQTRAAKSKFPEVVSACIADAAQVQSICKTPAHLDVFGDGDVFGDVKAPTVLVETATPPSTDYRKPACPTQEIIDLYHEALPAMPRVDILSDGRKRSVSARWGQVCADAKYTREQGLEWFAWFFGHVGKSAFLTGRVKGRNGDSFRCTFDFLMTPEKFTRVVENFYHKEAA